MSDAVTRAEFEAALRRIGVLEARETQVEQQVVQLAEQLRGHVETDRRLDEIEQIVAEALDRLRELAELRQRVEALEARAEALAADNEQLQARVELLERGGRRAIAD